MTDQTTQTTMPTPPSRATASILQPLFAPRGVAVVGASADSSKLGGAMAASLTSYDGYVALVNPRGGEGMVTSLSEATALGPIDLAVLCIPAPACPEVVAECGRAGIGAALVCAGGFAEAGGGGVEHQAALLETARRHGVRLLGPNTSGFFAPGRGLLASFVPGVGALIPGGVGVVAASGGLNHALAFAFLREQVGLSLGVGIGAGIDIAAPDVLDFLAEDELTTAVALHLETVSDGAALLAAVRRTAAIKPVVALVVGKNDIGAFARSHTGALATSWRTTRAVLRQAGAVIVDDVDALVTATAVLSRRRLAPKHSTAAGLVTAQAGPGLVIADAIHDTEIALPELAPTTRERLSGLLPSMTYQANPVDTGRPGPHHDDVVMAVAADPAIDVVAVYALTEPVVDLIDAAEPAHRAGSAVLLGIDGPPDDLVKVRDRAGQAALPLVVGPRAVGVALHALAEDADLQQRTREEAPPHHPVPERPGPVVPAEGLTESAAKDLLDTLGIATPKRRLVRTAAQAQAALAGIGGPVAVKISSAKVLHKSEVGGVRLGVSTEQAMDEAYAAIADAGRRSAGDDEVLIERMAPLGMDLIVGARRDPVFGPVVMVGVGGTATEIYADIAVASWPAPTGWLRRLPDQLAARALLNGHCGVPVADRGALASVLAALGGLLETNPSICEVEINPLRVTLDGLVALDAVVLTEPSQRSDH